jgi:hypothetical protein
VFLVEHLLFCVKFEIKKLKKELLCNKLLEFLYICKKKSTNHVKKDLKKNFICVIIISYTEYSRSNRDANVKNTHKGGWIIS